ncbi:MAG: hypothetical protein EBV03_00010 [Proteobacteria bacterium]|nr:hypothetical protein [Pseudomonadota bacterium]
MKRLVLLLLLGGLGATVVLLNVGTLFLLLALMPSIVAYFADPDPRKNAFKIVFSGNISAALPTLLPMVKAMINMRKFDITSAMQDPLVWMFIYLGAAAGWALIYLCKYVARFVVAMSFEYNIHSLENVQQMLIEEWGKEITEYKDAEDADEAA